MTTVKPQPQVVKDRYGWAVIWQGGFRSAMPDEETARLAANAADLLVQLRELVFRFEHSDAPEDIAAIDAANVVIDRAKERS